MNRPLDAALPEILGTDAVLRGLRVRTALSPDPMLETATALIAARPRRPREPAAGDAGAAAPRRRRADEALDEHELLGTKTRTLALPLVARDATSSSSPGCWSPTRRRWRTESVLQVLLAHAHAVERHTARDSVAARRCTSVLREAVAAKRGSASTATWCRRRSTAVASEPRRSATDVVAEAAKHVTAEVGRLDSRVAGRPPPVPGARAGDEGRSRSPATEAALDRLHRDGRHAAGRRGLPRRRAGRRSSARRWRTISRIESIEERRLLLCETLDCCSHRLDAWITAAASRRLARHARRRRRGAPSSAPTAGSRTSSCARPSAAGQIDGRSTCCTTAATAATSTRPGSPTPRPPASCAAGGSPIAAAIPNNEALDIDLSSTRMRDALSLLDGMRRGQSLGALLGYRLERRLHERSGGGLELDRFIYVLRTLAPLRGGKLTEPGQPVAGEPRGLRRRRRTATDGRCRRRRCTSKLEQGPDDQRYIVRRTLGAAAGRRGRGRARGDRRARARRTMRSPICCWPSPCTRLVSGNPGARRRGARRARRRRGGAAGARGACARRGPGSRSSTASRSWSPEPAAWPGRGLELGRAAGAAPSRGSSAGRKARLATRRRSSSTAAGADAGRRGLCPRSTCSTTPTATTSARARSPRGCERRSPTSATICRRSLRPGSSPGCCARCCSPGGRWTSPTSGARSRTARSGGSPTPRSCSSARARLATASKAARNAPRPAAEAGGASASAGRPRRRTRELSERGAGRGAGGAAGREAESRLQAAGALLGRAAAATEPRTRGRARLAGPGRGLRLRLRRRAAAAAAACGRGRPLGRRGGPERGRPGTGTVDPAVAGAGGGAARHGPPPTARRCSCAKRWEAGRCCAPCRRRQAPTTAGSGLPFGKAKPPMVPLASMVAEVAGASAGDPEPKLAGAIAGIVLDEWTEVRPAAARARRPRRPGGGARARRRDHDRESR